MIVFLVTKTKLYKKNAEKTV